MVKELVVDDYCAIGGIQIKMAVQNGATSIKNGLKSHRGSDGKDVHKSLDGAAVYIARLRLGFGLQEISHIDVLDEIGALFELASSAIMIAEVVRMDSMQAVLYPCANDRHAKPPFSGRIPSRQNAVGVFAEPPSGVSLGMDR